MKLLRRPGSTVSGSTALAAVGPSGGTDAEAAGVEAEALAAADAAELLVATAPTAGGGAAAPVVVPLVLETALCRSPSSSLGRSTGRGSTTAARGIGVGLAPNI